MFYQIIKKDNFYLVREIGNQNYTKNYTRCFLDYKDAKDYLDEISIKKKK